MIRSGVSSATFSMSMPPSVEAITTLRRVGPIEENRQVELAGDVDALFDVEAVNLFAGGPGLDGHQGRTKHLPGEIATASSAAATPPLMPAVTTFTPRRSGCSLKVPLPRRRHESVT